MAGSVGVVVILLPSGVSMLNTLAVAMNPGSRVCGLFGNDPATGQRHAPYHVHMPGQNSAKINTAKINRIALAYRGAGAACRCLL